MEEYGKFRFRSSSRSSKKFEVTVFYSSNLLIAKATAAKQEILTKTMDCTCSKINGPIRQSHDKLLTINKTKNTAFPIFQ